MFTNTFDRPLRMHTMHFAGKTKCKPNFFCKKNKTKTALSAVKLIWDLSNQSGYLPKLWSFYCRIFSLFYSPPQLSNKTLPEETNSILNGM